MAQLSRDGGDKAKAGVGNQDPTHVIRLLILTRSTTRRLRGQRRGADAAHPGSGE